MRNPSRRYLGVACLAMCAAIFGAIALGTNSWYEMSMGEKATMTVGLFRTCIGNKCSDNPYSDTICNDGSTNPTVVSGSELASRYQAVIAMALLGIVLLAGVAVLAVALTKEQSRTLWTTSVVLSALGFATFAVAVVLFAQTQTDWLTCGRGDVCSGMPNCTSNFGFSFALMCVGLGLSFVLMAVTAYSINFMPEQFNKGPVGGAVGKLNEETWAPQKTEAYRPAERNPIEVAHEMKPRGQPETTTVTAKEEPAQKIYSFTSETEGVKPAVKSLETKKGATAEKTPLLETHHDTESADPLPPVKVEEEKAKAPPATPPAADAAVPPKTTYLPPEGEDWEMTETGLYWSEAQQMYMDPESGHFYDPNSLQWYDPDSGEWYLPDETA